MQISKGYLKDRLVVTILKPEMFVGNVSHSILLPVSQQIEIEIPLQFPSSGELQAAALISKSVESASITTLVLVVIA